MLGIAAALLILIEILLIAVVRDYYYSSVKQFVTSKMNVVVSQITRNSDNVETNYNTEIRSIVENYSEKDKIEIMAIRMMVLLI